MRIDVESVVLNPSGLSEEDLLPTIPASWTFQDDRAETLAELERTGAENFLAGRYGQGPYAYR